MFRFAMSVVLVLALVAVPMANAETPGGVLVGDSVVISDPAHPHFGMTGTVLFVFDPNWSVENISYINLDAVPGVTIESKGFDSQLTVLP